MYFNLFSNCKLVEGAFNSAIIDLQRKQVYIIDYFFFNILIKFRNQTIENVLRTHSDKDNEKIAIFLSFLRENLLLNESANILQFKELDEKWLYPFSVSNAIIDFGDYTIVESSINNLNELNCQFLQIRFFNVVSNNEIKKIINYIDNAADNILSTEFIFSHLNKGLEDIIIRSNKTVAMYVFNCEYEYIDQINKIIFIYSQRKMISKLSCGNVSVDNFNVNIKNYTESISHNSCLNKKIAIDEEGNIRNCPSMSQSFGSIEKTTLEEALNHKDFKKYWNINKDQIEVCKDCEYRYICTDCRAYTERTRINKDGLDTSKPLKCGYDPYSGEWEEWSSNPLKEKTIKYYGMQDLVKKN